VICLRYPSLSIKRRENAVGKCHKPEFVFIAAMRIGQSIDMNFWMEQRRLKETECCELRLTNKRGTGTKAAGRFLSQKAKARIFAAEWHGILVQRRVDSLPQMIQFCGLLVIDLLQPYDFVRPFLRFAAPVSDLLTRSGPLKSRVTHRGPRILRGPQNTMLNMGFRRQDQNSQEVLS